MKTAIQLLEEKVSELEARVTVAEAATKDIEKLKVALRSLAMSLPPAQAHRITAQIN